MTNNIRNDPFKDAFQRAALYYIDNLVLGELPPRALRAEGSQEMADANPAAALNDRMLQSFAADLSPQNKSDVLNSTLLAQLAADAAYPRDEYGLYDVKGWYAKFSEVLLNLGWVSQNTYFQEYATKGQTFTVDKTLLEILNGLVQGNSYLLAQAALSALKNLSPADEKFTLFNFNTCSDLMGNISLGVCTEKNDTVEYSFAALYLEQKQKIRQILFIDFSSSQVKLFAGTNTITLIPEVYTLIREAVRQKINDHVRSYIAFLEI